MSVIVRDMPMPKNCMACGFLQSAYRAGWFICVRTRKETYKGNQKGMVRLCEERDKDCPLFEVKAWENI